MRRRIRPIVFVLTAAICGSLAAAQPPPAEVETDAAPDPRLRSDREVMEDQIRQMLGELAALRQQLAEAHLRASTAEAELTEMKQFLLDHDEYGGDFMRYREVREIAEREAHQKELEARRAEYEQKRAERRARIQQARVERAERNAERNRVNRYDRLGFSPLGLDVFVGKNAFNYQTSTTQYARYDYQIGFGRYLRYYPSIETDYSRMTISGSVLNGSGETRNIGVAIAFFDGYGNQVGAETVEIENARPDVPYPFTSTIDMALDRPFSSNSIYVLYADPVTN